MLLFMIRGGFAPISMDETGYCMEVERTKLYLEEILPGMGYILDSVTFTEEAGTHYLRAFIYRQDEEVRGASEEEITENTDEEVTGGN